MRRRYVLYRRRLEGDRRKLAIRCLDCLNLFCQSCARRHFVVLNKTYRAVDAALATVAIRAIRKLKPRCAR